MLQTELRATSLAIEDGLEALTLAVRDLGDLLGRLPLRP
jgi:hypothetical protein